MNAASWPTGDTRCMPEPDTFAAIYAAYAEACREAGVDPIPLEALATLIDVLALPPTIH